MTLRHKQILIYNNCIQSIVGKFGGESLVNLSVLLPYAKGQYDGQVNYKAQNR